MQGINQTTDELRAILVSLQRRYGTRTPAEKEEATLQWGAPWNLAEPIENIFFKLEELYVQAIIAGFPYPHYTQALLLDQALDKIKKTGLFIQTVVTWNARPPNEKHWANFKAHFTRAYDNLLLDVCCLSVSPVVDLHQTFHFGHPKTTLMICYLPLMY